MHCIVRVVTDLTPGSGSLPAPQSGHATAMMVFFAHLFILEDKHHHQTVISSSFYHTGPRQKFIHMMISSMTSCALRDDVIMSCDICHLRHVTYVIYVTF